MLTQRRPTVVMMHASTPFENPDMDGQQAALDIVVDAGITRSPGKVEGVYNNFAGCISFRVCSRWNTHAQG